MPNETLELSNAELAFVPDTPATAPATRVEVEINGKKRWFLVRLEFIKIEECDCFSFFYREENAACHDIHGREGYLVKPSSLSADNMKVFIPKHLDPNFSWRFWSVPGKEWALAANWAGWIYIAWTGRDKRLDQIHFRCLVPWNTNRFGDFPRTQFESFCQQLYDDHDSPLACALRWKNLSFEQRDDIAFGCQNGNWKSLTRLLSLAQIVVTYQCGYFPHAYQKKSRWVFDRDEIRAKRLGQTEAFQRLKRWRSAVCRIIQPAFWPEEPDFVTQWRHNPFRQHDVYQVECTMPTAHEVIEAQIELREFLRPHLSAEAIEALMRPEQIQL